MSAKHYSDNTPFSRGAMYEKVVGETSTRAAAAALSHLPLSTYGSDTKILDSACGPGIVTKLLLSPSPDYISVPGLPMSDAPAVVGIDLSQPMIEQYQANAASLQWDTAEAHTQSAQDLSRFPDKYFDAVIMNFGIFALPDPVAGTREMYRVLKPGGHALITTWKTRRPQDLMAKVYANIRPEGGKIMDIDPKWMTVGHLVDVLREAGFDQDKMKIDEAAPMWSLGSISGIVKGLSSPMFTAQYHKGWSEEEVSKWGFEIEKQLTDKEKETGTLEMVAYIYVAQKASL
ncbi:S-adenosyl-L-methionine-dependent methyltransferase [Xylariaceae sp. FL1272]|nr:S-adenosyl-L-methionine-dependent methyltransferase [Xylariaceae sp. FL1272]